MPVDRWRWRWAAASRIGTSHLKAGTRKQDAYTVKVIQGASLCLVVSDGAGSASHGGQGASLACRLLAGCVQEWTTSNSRLPSDDEIYDWIDAARDRIAVVAASRSLTKRQFACTLIVLVVHGEEVLALQIGDSALVGRREGRWEALCWPENGEFASTTYFLTDDPEPRLRIARMPYEFDAFAAFSDGIESLALQHAELQPHPRFFDPMIKPVDEAEGKGRLANLSAALGRYLDSAAICERTDDDKTLVLVSRK